MPHLEADPYCLGSISIAPIGADSSLSEYMSMAHQCMERNGLKHSMHPCSTDYEGPFEQVMTTLRECHQELHESGVPRIYTTVTVETASDQDHKKHRMSLAEREKMLNLRSSS
ncbi:hypothetical protein BDF22DRAFT_623647 [Syncephalis plumigaleata]|nr:hypothetical protein BDF22DRAFT_623647 [Syncephalis plumigaleata]